jgi:hypothetical protein
MSNAAEVAGLQKLARLSPEQIRALFLRSGTMQGGLRGALLGGALGYLTADKDDPESVVKRVGLGLLGGGGVGAFAGRLHGHHLSSTPFRSVTDEHGGKLLYLRRPGVFSEELIHAHYPAGHPESRLTVDRPGWMGEQDRVYKPEVGSRLLGELLRSQTLPQQAL